MSANRAALELGSNIDPGKNIKEAIDILTQEFTLIAVSRLLWTKPVGFSEQADFINAAIELVKHTGFKDPADITKHFELFYKTILTAKTARRD